MDPLLLPDGTIQIHNRLTEAFDEHFICPQQQKHVPLQTDNDIDHDRFLTDEEYFKTTVSKTFSKIPQEALDSIWYEISHVPKRSVTVAANQYFKYTEGTGFHRQCSSKYRQERQH